MTAISRISGSCRVVVDAAVVVVVVVAVAVVAVAVVVLLPLFQT